MNTISKWLVPALLMTLTGIGIQSAKSQTLTTLHSFSGPDGDGPWGSLIQATNGSLYGVTFLGGGDSDGTMFKISLDGGLKTVATFGPDGATGPLGLMQDSNGDFYGTTIYGAAPGEGNGTVFKLTPNGKLTILVSLDGANGSLPAALIQATNGNLYGTTEEGGTYSDGTVFTLTKRGTLTTIQSFDGTDGFEPVANAGLIQATDGNFYGTTILGGTYSSGTVFKITPSGELTTLYNFCSQLNCADGIYPEAGLIQASDGNFYGTTVEGGTNGSCWVYVTCGTVYRITPSGEFTSLYSFCSQPNCSDGANPFAGLIQATDGNLYGTTTYGGNGNNGELNGDAGTVFKITTAGELTTVYRFCSVFTDNLCMDGDLPGNLTQATNGDLYGTTQDGGAVTFGGGTVFRLTVGLGPFVALRTTSGEVGTNVGILGTELTGASSVTFNGTPSTFKIVSKSEIEATVPIGATTGTITVTTPRGVLSSSKSFTVQE